MNIKSITAYFYLLRLHKPIGILLLWYPTACALWIANQGRPPFLLVLYFFLGTFIMRSAGCLVNDIADRHIDPHVARTKTRPLATGQIRLEHAFVILIALIFMGFAILLTLPKACFVYALLSIGITVIYPFCKRFFQAPQLILGIAFSMGIPMAYAASSQTLNISAILLLGLNFCWIMAYDTIYALGDMPDDLEINIKSTAIFFGHQVNNIILAFQALTQSMWLMLAYHLKFNAVFYLAWIVSCLLLSQQQLIIRKPEPDYLKTFTSNSYYGLVLWIAVMICSYSL